jgi:cyclohexadieny/prephenate dehydrogenase
MRISTLAIVGVGLLGGSVALAARRRGVADRIIGTDLDPTVLDGALRDGMLDEVYLHPSRTVGDADFIVFCTPVDRIADQVVEAARHCPPDALLTDVGSTKAAIVRDVHGRLPAGVEFVGSHPLAGSEKRGPEFACADLFVDRCTVLTPTDKTDPGAVETVRSFWQALGSRVRLMSPEEHDRALAVTSHLPHLVASALCGILPDELHELIATGFRSTTRVAAGDPGLWSAIFEQNRPALLAALVSLTDRLQHFQRALESRDRAALDELLTQGKRVRDALGS